MKMEKGQPGYLTARKRKYLLIAVLEFAVVAALIILGVTQTGTKLNLLTVVAVLGCLPASKMLVEFIVMVPYRTIERVKYEEIEEKTKLLTRSYDMLLTSNEKLALIEAAVILDHTVCGYTSNRKTSPEETAAHIKDLLRENHMDKITVKIFHEYTPFLTRAEGLNNMAAVNRPETENKEQKIRSIILSASM